MLKKTFSVYDGSTPNVLSPIKEDPEELEEYSIKKTFYNNDNDEYDVNVGFSGTNK
jgi:hypothetical protein